MTRLQRGLGTFGTLVILAIAGAAGYYIEAPQAQACQESCQRDAAACEARKR